MPQLKIIASHEAPPIPTRQSQYALDLLGAMRSLKEGQVLRVTPDSGKSLRGLRAGIGRILKGAGLEAKTWDDGTHAYIIRLQDPDRHVDPGL